MSKIAAVKPDYDILEMTGRLGATSEGIHVLQASRDNVAATQATLNSLDDHMTPAMRMAHRRGLEALTAAHPDGKGPAAAPVATLVAQAAPTKPGYGRRGPTTGLNA